MRALGLLGMLVVIGVIAWIMSATILPHTEQVIKTQKKLDPQVKQMAGRDAQGYDARDSITIKPELRNGRLTGILVTDVIADGAMEKYFGVKQGDVIVEIAPGGGAMMPVADMGSAADAKDMLLSSYANSQQITVMRAGKKLTLPATPPSAGPTNSTPQKLGDIKIPTH
jgi:hypothetical protein